MLRTHYASQLSQESIGQKVRIAGWIEDVRPLGSLLFVTVRDVTGIAQAVFNKKSVTEAVFDAAKQVSRQSSVTIEGHVQKSVAKGIPVEVKANHLEVLSEAVHPLPIDPTGRVSASIDLVLDARALSLRNPKNLAIFKIRQAALEAMRNTLTKMGFMEVNTSRIIGQAAEGGANLFSLDYFDKPAYLAQSPQLYKEQLTLALDRVFEIGNFFRAEKSATRKHVSEFTSVDIEAAFADEDDVMSMAEDLMLSVFDYVKEHRKLELELLGHKLPILRKPFERISYAQAVSELKRRDLEIRHGDDLTDSMLRELGNKHKGFFWIVEWPTMLKPFYIETRADDPKISKGFDLQYGYLEIASGGMRVSNRRKLEQRLKEAGLSPESFASHLKTFEFGMPPHAGWAIGLDRLMMVLTNAKNIRDVVLYPRDRFRLTP